MKRFALMLCALAGTLASAGAGQAAPVLTFIIDGDTFDQPFAITNSSTAGGFVTRFQLNLVGTSPALVFDPVSGGPPGNGSLGTPFTPRDGTGVTTGLVLPVVVPDGSTLLDISFTGFGPGETFRWDIDVDPLNPNSSSTVTGNQLIGATGIVDFSNGQRLIGVLSAVEGNPDASQFVVTGITTTPTVPEPATCAAFGLMGAAGFGYVRRRLKAASVGA